MKHLKISFFAFLSIALCAGFTSCNDDDENDSDVTSSHTIGLPRKLLKISENNRVKYDKFTYDEQNRITSYYSHNYQMSIAYEGSLIKIWGDFNAQCELSDNLVSKWIQEDGFHSFGYLDNKITTIKGEIYASMGTDSYDYDYTWDADGNLIKMNHKRVWPTASGFGPSTSVRNYSYNGGEKSKINILALLDDFSPLYLETYDDIELLGLMGYFGDLSTQYPTSCRYIQYANAEFIINAEFSYSLDDQGYPTRIDITTKHEDGNEYKHVYQLEWE